MRLIVKDYAENIHAVAEFLKEQDTIQQQVLIKIQYMDETAEKSEKQHSRRFINR